MGVTKSTQQQAMVSGAIAPGLVVVGPTERSLAGLIDLLPPVHVIEVDSTVLATAKHASAYSVGLSREATAASRRGALAVVLVDTYDQVGTGLTDEHERLACDRLARVLLGLADHPAYVALHGDMLPASVVGPGATKMDALPDMPEHSAVWMLGKGDLVPNLNVAVCPSDAGPVGLVQLVVSLESRTDHTQ